MLYSQSHIKLISLKKVSIKFLKYLGTTENSCRGKPTHQRCKTNKKKKEIQKCSNKKSERLTNCSTPLHSARLFALNTLKRGLTFPYFHSPMFHPRCLSSNQKPYFTLPAERRIFADGNRRKYAALCPVHFLAHSQHFQIVTFEKKTHHFLGTLPSKTPAFLYHF